MGPSQRKQHSPASLPAQCSVRGHGGHLFGDMTDRLIVGQVDGCDLMGGKEDAVTPVSAERSDGEAFAAESLRNFPLPTFEADVSLGGRDSPDDLVVVVFGLRQPI